tara:strand:+ start:294 stop:551 length:258 start_codon:yes stop_codon:yes gene_type:complete
MAKRKQSLSQKISTLSPDLEFLKFKKNQISNMRIAYDERAPQKTFIPQGAASNISPSTPIVSSGNLLTQAGNNLITQAGNNIITN